MYIHRYMYMYALQAKKGGPKAKDLDTLLVRFCEQKHPHLVEGLRTELGSETRDDDAKKIAHLNYGQVCRTSPHPAQIHPPNPFA
jgi:hypothetical protein